MSETLPLLIERVDTPIGEIEMLIVADREGNRALWIGQTTRYACVDFCVFTTVKMGLGSNRLALRMT